MTARVAAGRCALVPSRKRRAGLPTLTLANRKRTDHEIDHQDRLRAVAAGLRWIPGARGGGQYPYSEAAFADAQAAGKTIIVDVFADWCPTCRAQKPILDELKAEPKLKDSLFVTVDYDREKAFLRAHRVPRQSTILVFRGGNEVARSVAETDRDRLRTAVLSAAGG